MNILITGGSGSLGRALVRRLLKDGAERIVVAQSTIHHILLT